MAGYGLVIRPSGAKAWCLWVGWIGLIEARAKNVAGCPERNPLLELDRKCLSVAVQLNAAVDCFDFC